MLLASEVNIGLQFGASAECVGVAKGDGEGEEQKAGDQELGEEH